jgi:hypothetical protein
VFKKRGFGEAAVILHWPAIVGTTLAAASCPERLTATRGGETGGTLTVRVRPAFALELQHLAPAVIERINSFYGHRKIARLKLVQGPVPERKEVRRRALRSLTPSEEAELAALVARADEGPVKTALKALGSSLIASRPSPRDGLALPSDGQIRNS